MSSPGLTRDKPKGGDCPKCGATRVDQQLGLEASPDLFVAAMVDVFREVRRVLRSDGTLWLNLGDSYATQRNDSDWIGGKGGEQAKVKRGWHGGPDMKPKDLCGIPWRVAFALQADGWVLRSDITWSKSNPMPESATDRPTKAHEMIFLFAKAKWTGPERGRFADISDEDARWLALLFDAEGNVVVKKAVRDERTQYGAQIAFANTSRALIERAQAIVGMGSIHERPGTNAPMFYWQMTGQQARDLLYRIYPFLIVKPRQAALAIHMQDVIAEPKKRPGGYRTDEHTAFLDKCWLTMKALNSFEHPDISWVPEPRYGRWTSQPYFFDQEAVREPHTPDGRKVTQVVGQNGSIQHRDGERWPNGGRNVRSVWEIATQPYPEAHFATFPEALPERCIKAGTSERGCCPVCGAPWAREVERELLEVKERREHPSSLVRHGPPLGYDGGVPKAAHHTVGWAPSCTCGSEQGVIGQVGTVALNPVPCTVLDPFMGSGTTALVARRLGRRSIGVELNPEYAALCARRLQQLSLFGGDPEPVASAPLSRPRGLTGGAYSPPGQSPHSNARPPKEV